MPPPATPEVPRKKRRVRGSSEQMLAGVDENDPTFMELTLDPDNPDEGEETTGAPMESPEGMVPDPTVLGTITTGDDDELTRMMEYFGEMPNEDDPPRTPVREELAIGMINTLNNAMKKKIPARTVNRRRFTSLEDDETIAYLKKKEDKKQAKEKKKEDCEKAKEEKRIEAIASRRVHEETELMMKTVEEEGLEGLRKKVEARAKTGRGGGRGGGHGSGRGRGGVRTRGGRGGGTGRGGLRTRGGSGASATPAGRPQTAKRGGASNVSPPSANDLFGSDLNVPQAEEECDR